MAKKTDTSKAATDTICVSELLEQGTLAYAAEVIQERAIPRIDGLKPVHRRLLYTYMRNNATHKHRFVKCATIAGATLKYHPHGDSSVYGALCNLVVPWRQNVPLIVGMGNFGSRAGDGPAASRYTESRLAEATALLFEDMDKNTDMIPSYDGRDKEPSLLPVKWPLLFTNGSEGIAVGFSTSIAPHNPLELMKAAIYVNKNPGATLKKIMQFVPAPDFPTGGVVIDSGEDFKNLFETGEGRVIMRAKVNKEGANKLIVTEIPFGQTTVSVMQSISDAVEKANLEDSFIGLDDESTGDAIRLVITLKRGTDEDAILAFLYAKTNLQCNYNSRNVVIVDGRPKTIGLLEYLHLFVDLRRTCIRRTSETILEDLKARKHVVDGLVRMTEFPDEIIAEVKASDGKADASKRLQDKFDFTAIQADAIVSMQLYKISRQDVQTLLAERDKLNDSIAYHTRVVEDDDFLVKITDDELKETSKFFAKHDRRTEIRAEDEAVDTSDVNVLELKKAQPCMVTFSPSAAQKMTRQMYDNSITEPESPVVRVCESTTTDCVVAFTRKGLTMQRIASDLEHTGLKKTADTFVRAVKAFTADDEIVTGITFPYGDLDSGKLDDLMVVSVTKYGQVKQCPVSTMLLSFNNKGYMTRNKIFNGLKKKDDEIIFVAVMERDKVDSLTMSLKRKSGGRVKKMTGADITEQGGTGSGANALKVKTDDSCVITTTNASKLTEALWMA